MMSYLVPDTLTDKWEWGLTFFFKKIVYNTRYLLVTAIFLFKNTIIKNSKKWTPFKYYICRICLTLVPYALSDALPCA